MVEWSDHKVNGAEDANGRQRFSVPREQGLLGESQLAEERSGVVVGANRRGATIVGDCEHIGAIEVERLAGRRDTWRESLAGMRARHAPFAGDAKNTRRLAPVRILGTVDFMV